ncbi:hypothetical protein EVAR_23231_1 [Eumeta japonica]|uniref:Uncharacterized protein n=1 Tax=Eumeta variegata TaxID=151549 RepID=A0A4C1VE95_EUMVA|nr:hypothetical protein EVAR_23231_1 [Eumeta japonica]
MSHENIHSLRAFMLRKEGNLRAGEVKRSGFSDIGRFEFIEFEITSLLLDCKDQASRSESVTLELPRCSDVPCVGRMLLASVG